MEPVDRLGERREVGALDRGRLVALDLRRLADADHLRAAGLLGAGGEEPAERLLGGGGDLAPLGEEDRRAQRRRHELGGGDGDAPVGRADQRDRGRPGVVPARRIDGLGDAGGVGDRVRAADPRRVHRRERREAELGRGLLLVAALAEDRRLLGGRVSRVVSTVAAASATGEHEHENGEQQRRTERGAHAYTR
jgi:hypothetical protein